MGMDLSPKNPDCEWGRFNWSGWGTILSLIESCGADTSMAAGSNDGDYVRKDDAEAWGLAMLAHLDRIVVVAVPDSTYVGGMREHLVALDVEATDDALAQFTVTAQAQFAGAQVKRLDAESRSWVIDSAVFFINSHGFHQY